MNSEASSAADWLRWLQIIEAYFRNHKYLFSIWKYGCFQLLCTEFGEEVLVGVPGTNLAAAMAAASTPAASSGTTPPSSPSTGSAPAMAVTKYRCVADSTHPLFESLRINNNVMELQVANEFMKV